MCTCKASQTLAVTRACFRSAPQPFNSYSLPANQQRSAMRCANNRICRCASPHPSRDKMLRFLKKGWKSHKSSKKLIPPGTPAHQITVTGAGASDGERLSGKVLEPTRPMGLMKPSNQIPTTEGVLESQLGTRGLEIKSFLLQSPQP